MTEGRPHGPGLAMLVVPMPGSVRPPTDSAAAMIAWLFAHGAPRTAEVLRRLQRHAWAIEPPDPDAATQTELWATARFADVEQARAAARLNHGRVSELMRWARRPARRRHVAAVRRAARALNGPGVWGGAARWTQPRRAGPRSASDELAITARACERPG